MPLVTVLVQPSSSVAAIKDLYTFILHRYLQNIAFEVFIWQATFKVTFLKKIRCLWVASRAWVSMLDNIIPESMPSDAVLVLPLSSIAAVSKGLKPLLQKSNQSGPDLCERLHPRH